jgi:hypothetical protein
MIDSNPKEINQAGNNIIYTETRSFMVFTTPIRSIVKNVKPRSYIGCICSSVGGKNNMQNNLVRAHILI